MKKFLVFALAVLFIGALATGVLAQAVPATIDFDPDTLNLNSKGKWVTVYISPADTWTVDDINIESVELQDGDGGGPVSAAWGQVQDGVLMVKFDRAEVQAAIGSPGPATITVTGEVGATTFSGSDTIRVIEKGKP